jgi:hypothetical protein
MAEQNAELLYVVVGLLDKLGAGSVGGNYGSVCGVVRRLHLFRRLILITDQRPLHILLLPIIYVTDLTHGLYDIHG